MNGLRPVASKDPGYSGNICVARAFFKKYLKGNLDQNTTNNSPSNSL